MSKLSRPVQGRCSKTFLEELRNEFLREIDVREACGRTYSHDTPERRRVNFLNRLIEAVNSDACLSGGQADLLRRAFPLDEFESEANPTENVETLLQRILIWFSQNRFLARLIIGTPEKVSQLRTQLSSNAFERRMQELLGEKAALINGFRLNCADCLTPAATCLTEEDGSDSKNVLIRTIILASRGQGALSQRCHKRAPDVPVEAVIKRSKAMGVNTSVFWDRMIDRSDQT